jgi:hypothetical protein
MTGAEDKVCRCGTGKAGKVLNSISRRGKKVVSTDNEGLGPRIALWSRDTCKGVVKY